MSGPSARAGGSISVKSKPSVFIAMPNLGQLAVGHTQNLLAWQMSGKYRWNWKPIVGVSPYDRARNKCHEEFMKSGCEYLLFLDADTVPPMNALDLLLAADKDMISAVVQTVQSHKDEPRLIPIALRWNDEDPEDVGLKAYIGKGIEEVDATTLACTLIKRKVMKAVGPRAFQFNYTDEYGTDGIGEDIYFNVKVKEAGFKIFCHYGVVCSHLKKIDMKQVNDLMLIAYRDGQKSLGNRKGRRKRKSDEGSR